jgi:hypothetical protein
MAKLLESFELIAHLFDKKKSDSLRGQLKGKAPGPSEAIKHLLELKLVVASDDGYVFCNPIPKKLNFACSTFCAAHCYNKGWCSGRVKNGNAVPGVDRKTWHNPNWDGEGLHPDWGSAKSPWTLESGLPTCPSFIAKQWV